MIFITFATFFHYRYILSTVNSYILIFTFYISNSTYETIFVEKNEGYLFLHRFDVIFIPIYFFRNSIKKKKRTRYNESVVRESDGSEQCLICTIRYY